MVDLRDLSRKTPLILAAYAGHVEICALLLDSGASVAKYDEFGWTSLMMAAFAGHADVVALLLDRGASNTTANRKVFPLFSFFLSFFSLLSYGIFFLLFLLLFSG